MEHWGKPNLFFLSSSELQHAARQKKATRWSTNAIFFLIIALSDNISALLAIKLLFASNWGEFVYMQFAICTRIPLS